MCVCTCWWVRGSSWSLSAYPVLHKPHVKQGTKRGKLFSSYFHLSLLYWGFVLKSLQPPLMLPLYDCLPLVSFVLWDSVAPTVSKQPFLGRNSELLALRPLAHAAHAKPPLKQESEPDALKTICHQKSNIWEREECLWFTGKAPREERARCINDPFVPENRVCREKKKACIEFAYIQWNSLYPVERSLSSWHYM